MELENLKKSWQKENNMYTQLHHKDMAVLEKMLSGKTTDLVSSMRRKYEKIITMMLISMLLMILVFPLLSDGFTYPGSIYGFTKCMFFYVLLVIFYWVKLRSVYYMELSDFLRERLQQLLKISRRSLWIETGFAIAFYVALLTIGRFFYGKGLEGLDTLEMLGFFLGSLVAAGTMIYLIVSRHFRQIDELKRYLKEYEEVRE